MNNLKDIHNLRQFVILECLLFYQDFNEQFEGYTQLLYCAPNPNRVVLSGFQWTIWRIYTTNLFSKLFQASLFYQDFNEQFEGYTQLDMHIRFDLLGCFIRISMNNLKDIHNCGYPHPHYLTVVLSGFQWTIWRIYTTITQAYRGDVVLFYQDFNEQFEGYTQQDSEERKMIQGCFIRISMNNLKDIHNWYSCFVIPFSVVLSGFQWTIWRIYTTGNMWQCSSDRLFYQDFNEQFEGYTQRKRHFFYKQVCCFIRISMNNLKDIHN